MGLEESRRMVSWSEFFSEGRGLDAGDMVLLGECSLGG